MRIIPPSVVRLRIAPRSGSAPTLLLPVFLLWPLVLVLVLPLLVLGLLVLVVLDAHSVLRWLALLSTLYTLVCELRGIHVDVRGSGSQVLVSVF